MEKKPIKVLLIEDNRGDARLIQEMLAEARRVNFDLQCAERVSTGMKHLSGDGIAVILLDLKLPDSSGIDTVIRVRERVSAIPIIVLTGSFDESLGIKAVREGAQDYLLKDRLDSNLLERSILYAIERQKAEEMVRESEEKYRSLVTNMPDVAWTTDYRGNTVFISANVKEVYGYSPEEVYKGGDRIWFGRIHPEDVARVKEAYELLFTEGVRFDVEYRIKRKDENWIWLHNRAVSTYERDGVLYADGVFSDITEPKKAEEELKNAYQELKQSQQQLIQSAKMAAMGQLASGVCHELNQPLTGIKGFAQVALMDLDEKSPIRKDLQKIVAQADRMDEIIKNVRHFARKSEFKMEELDINQPLEASLILLSQQLRVHNIQLKKSLAKDLPKIEGDKNELQQVFLNLITNARDSIDSAKNRSDGELIVKSSLSKDKKNIEITFKDTGYGISKEDLPNIFNPFFTTKSPDGGIGLGLSITYRIIENHKGTIQVFSEEGKGATFKITLPTPPSLLARKVKKETAPLPCGRGLGG